MNSRDLINQEISDYNAGSITIVNGYDFNQKQTIEKIIRNYNGKFEHGDVDVEGDKKYFFNIVKNPCKVVTKAIDFDTKHILIQTAGGGNALKTWYFERDFRQWMKEMNFGRVLNRIFEELPIFGSVVLKIVKGKPYFVDLRNFAIEQSADTLDGSNYIIEKHLYTPLEFEKIAAELNWNEDEVNQALKAHRETNEPYIAVFERYGEIDGEYTRSFLADVKREKRDLITGEIFVEQGIILKEDSIEKHPYFEFHLEKIPGRWLGVGMVELLFDNQMRANELVNQTAKGTYWASIRLFQTRDETQNKNLATECVNGQIITSESAILPVDTQERNLGYFVQETQKWLGNRDEVTFSYDVTRGERLPSGTPLGSARLAAAMSFSHFDQIRENVALDVKKLLYDVIIPYFEKEMSLEHFMRVAGEDLDQINQLLIEDAAFKETVNFALKKNRLPSKQEYETLKTSLQTVALKVKERQLIIPSGFYKDAKYKIDIVITGESKDLGAQAQVLFTAMQAIQADPTILENPLKKQILSMWLERGGFPPAELNLTTPIRTIEEMVPPEAMMPRKVGGGGISAPMPQTALERMPTETRV